MCVKKIMYIYIYFASLVHAFDGAGLFVVDVRTTESNTL